MTIKLIAWTILAFLPIATTVSAKTNVEPDDFVKYCQKSDHSKDAKYTLAIISHNAQSSNCEEMYSYLLRHESIFLKDDNLVDVEAFKYIDSLEELQFESKMPLKLEGLNGNSTIKIFYVDAPISGFKFHSEALETVLISKAKSLSLTDLAKSKNLSNIMIYSTKTTDMDKFSQFEKVESATFHDIGLNSIKELSPNTTVMFLDLARNSIKDIEGIGGFTNITDLDLSSNLVGVIKPLLELKSLEGLNLRGNPVEDINLVSKIKKLLYLDVSSMGLENLNFLGDHPDLIKLFLSKNRLSDVSKLAEYPTLVHIDIGKNTVTDINALASLKNLVWLFAYDNLIKEPIRLSPRLGQLDLSENLFRDLDWLNSNELPNLYNLDIKSNGISDLSPISKLQRLKYINFSNNIVSSFPEVIGTEKFYGVYARDNKLTSLDGFRHMIVLESLDVRRNRITNVTPIKDLDKLKRLELAWNYVGSTVHKTKETCPTDGYSALVTEWCSVTWVDEGEVIHDTRYMGPITDSNSMRELRERSVNPRR